jgi:hypothetical protein
MWGAHVKRRGHLGVVRNSDSFAERVRKRRFAVDPELKRNAKNVIEKIHQLRDSL